MEVSWVFEVLERERELILSRFPAVRTVGSLRYAARATRGHQFGGVPTTPTGRDLFLLMLFFG